MMPYRSRACHDQEHDWCNERGWDADDEKECLCPCACHVRVARGSRRVARPTHSVARTQTAPEVLAWCTCGARFDAYGTQGALNKLYEHIRQSQ